MKLQQKQTNQRDGDAIQRHQTGIRFHTQHFLPFPEKRKQDQRFSEDVRNGAIFARKKREKDQTSNFLASAPNFFKR